MNCLVRLTLPFALTAGLVAASEGSAAALGPVDIEAGAKIGVGTNPDSAGPNPFGFGLGGRAGVSIFGIYGGVSAVHYLGTSGDPPSGTSATAGIAIPSPSSTLIGGELGYTITAIPIIQVRPQVGLGNAHIAYGPVSNDHLYLEPGVTVLVPLGFFFVGADANLLVLPAVDTLPGETTTYTSFTAHGQIGFRL